MCNEDESVPPAAEGAAEPRGRRKPKKKLTRLQRLGLAVNLELLLTWIQLSNIPPLFKMGIKRQILLMYRHIFPEKRTTERRRTEEEKPSNKEPKSSRGRRGAKDFPDAPRERHPLDGVKPGDPCVCGGVFGEKQIRESVQFMALPPIQVVVHQCECVRCSSCNLVCRAQLPDQAVRRHHPTAISMVALMKYGSGFPFYRLESFLGHLGLPLRASTQFEMVAAGIPAVRPVYEEMGRLGALGEILQTDDTSGRITKYERPEEFAERTGIFTTGILSFLGSHKIGLFKTSAKHSGENMTEMLKSRPPGLARPIFLADGLARNFPKVVEDATKVAKCLVHGRRYFVDLEEAFPEQSKYVLDSLGTVFFNDALDVLVLWKLDRLGRDLRHLVNTVHDLNLRGVGIRILTGQGASIDTTTPSGKLAFGIFAALAEFERELISERTKAGLTSARARGRIGGAPFKMTAAKLRLAMAAMGKPETEVGKLCKELGVSRQTLYRHVAPDGSLRADGQKLLGKKRAST